MNAIVFPDQPANNCAVSLVADCLDLFTIGVSGSIEIYAGVGNQNTGNNPELHQLLDHLVKFTRHPNFDVSAHHMFFKNRTVLADAVRTQLEARDFTFHDQEGKTLNQDETEDVQVAFKKEMCNYFIRLANARGKLYVDKMQAVARQRQEMVQYTQQQGPPPPVYGQNFMMHCQMHHQHPGYHWNPSNSYPPHGQQFQPMSFYPPPPRVASASPPQNLSHEQLQIIHLQQLNSLQQQQNAELQHQLQQQVSFSSSASSNASRSPGASPPNDVTLQNNARSSNIILDGSSSSSSSSSSIGYARPDSVSGNGTPNVDSRGLALNGDVSLDVNFLYGTWFGDK